MGFKNMPAICPSCGGKIHTEPEGRLGSIAMEVVGANGPMLKTGSTCEHCGAQLTGKVTARNYAVLAVESEPPLRQPPSTSATSWSGRRARCGRSR